MKNISNEKPSLSNLNSRMAYTLKGVSRKDIRNKTILDVGCGFGWCELDFLKKEVKKVIGMEISTSDLAAAKSTIKDKRAEFIVGSGIDIPLKKESIETIVCFEVIEHIPKNTEKKLFSEAHRVLKKGGAFYLSTPYDHPLTKTLDPAWWLIGHRHYSKRKLEKYGLDNGFKVESIKIKGGIWGSLALLYMYIGKWILRMRKPPFLDYLEKLEDSTYATDRGEGIGTIFVTYRKK
jgi:SAM-dependent methyltransferase